MTVYYYDNNLGNITNSDGVNDFLLGSPPTYYRSLSALVNKYVPYYVKHDSLNEWEYGLGQVVNNAGQDVLVRSIIYSSSNSNAKVVFTAGSKTVVATINAERISHGGYNYTDKTSTFTADTVQTIYGVSATSSSITGYLPLASGNKNLLLGFKLKSGSSYNLVVDASGTDTIDGSGLLTLTPDTKYVELISDGSGWYELSRDIQISGVGLPSGSAGSIQFKSSSTLFGGGSDLFWDSTNKYFLVGGSSVSSANMVLPASSGQNTIINKLGYDSDLQVKGTGTNQLYFDASAGRLGINTNTPSTICHIVGRCASDTLRVESTTACATGVALTLYHSPSAGSSIDDYPATINLAGRNSNGQQVNYAQIRSKILGTTIGSTSGEIVISVDNSGVSTSIIAANAKKTVLGLGSIANNTNNIIIGNLTKDSGVTNIVIGHSTSVSGSVSANNIVLAHNTNLQGSNNFVAGYLSTVSGSQINTLGGSNQISGSGITVCGNTNLINGTKLSVAGNNNTVSGVFNLVQGFNNSIINNTGVILGSENTVSGNLSMVVGTTNNLTGDNNNLVGLSGTVSGSNNTVLGSSVSVSGANSIVIGNNNNIVSAQSGIAIGNNLSITNLTGLLMGFGSGSLIITTSQTTINPNYTNNVFAVYGSSTNSGLYYSNNNLGINKMPSGYQLDVNGSVRALSLYTDTIRLGNSSTDQSVIVSDTSGNGSWQPLSTIQSAILTNVNTNSVVSYNGSGLTSANGLFTSSTGVFTSDIGAASPHIIIPTGNSAFVINANNKALNPIFNIRGVGQNNLLVVDATNNRIGINTDSPSYNVHASGNMRVFKDSLYFMEKNNDQFIVAYDIGPSTPNRLQISASGIIIEQPSNGTVLPQHSFSVNPNTTTSNLIKHLVWDTNDNKFKHSNFITAGFQSFTGSSDS